MTWGREFINPVLELVKKECGTCNIFGNHCLLLIAFVSDSVQGRNMYLFTAVE